MKRCFADLEGFGFDRGLDCPRAALAEARCCGVAVLEKLRRATQAARRSCLPKRVGPGLGVDDEGESPTEGTGQAALAARRGVANAASSEPVQRTLRTLARMRVLAFGIPGSPTRMLRRQCCWCTAALRVV